MKRLVLLAALSVMASANPAVAQNTKAIEQEVKALNAAWGKAWAAHDADAYMSFIDTKGPGLFMIGGVTYTPDSLRAMFTRIVGQRSAEEWTDDRVIVTPLNDNTAFLQVVGHGHFTLQNGQTWEYSAAGTTALVRKQGSTWKIVAFQNAIGGGKQVKK